MADVDLLWKAIVLGIVQGLTEFLPVSSTAHLILVPVLFGWPKGFLNELPFDVALHLGTLVALLAVFWRDWVELALAALRSLRDRSLEDPQARLAWLIVLATIPAALAGALFQKYIERELRSPLVIGTALIVVGVILFVIDRMSTRTRDEHSLGIGSALAIGVGQALALIPGVSRSGATIAVGLAAGLTRPAAARFSFLLSTPIITGAIAKEFIDLAGEGIPSSEVLPLVVGILAAAITGYLCIRFLLSYLRRRSLTAFVVYRIVLGIVVIALTLSGRLTTA
jgi:undecaprenyl-diphosphatase